MVLLSSDDAKLGWDAVDFNLLGVDGKQYTLESTRGTKGLVVIMMCNHCPYVQKQLEEMILEGQELPKNGVGVVAIMPNDASKYPEDSYENMKELSDRINLPFPYLIDETQEVARAYGAVCTPDIFGFDQDLKLRYRGRLVGESGERELYNYMMDVVDGKELNRVQNASIGCSIKWRSEDGA